VKALGLCGLMDRITLMITEQAACNLTECSLLLLYNQQFPDNSLEYTSETQTHNLLCSTIKMMEVQPYPTSPQVELSRFISSGKVLPSKLLRNIRIHSVSLFTFPSGLLDGTLPQSHTRHKQISRQ